MMHLGRGGRTGLRSLSSLKTQRSRFLYDFGGQLHRSGTGVGRCAEWRVRCGREPFSRKGIDESRRAGILPSREVVLAPSVRHGGATGTVC
jgi:hypothetical protein